jgi:NADH-quinone oxidoreductase subunit C
MSRVEATAEALVSRIGERAVRLAALPGEIAIEVAAADLVAVCRELRDAPEFAFEQLIDLSGIDYLDYGRDEWATNQATSTGFSRGVERAPRDEAPATAGRFAVSYQLLSVARNTRLRLRCRCAAGEPPMIDSVTGVWTSADWYEREAFDLYGILFRGHPDLRRILTDYGFIGHPFRKDFPLSGHVEVRYDPSRGRVVNEPVSIEPRVTVPKVIRKGRDPGAQGTGGDA